MLHVVVQVDPSGLPRVVPMRLRRKAEPFNSPHWLFERKIDGFRAVAYVQGGQCELVSRNGSGFKGATFRNLAERTS